MVFEVERKRSSLLYFSEEDYRCLEVLFVVVVVEQPPAPQLVQQLLIRLVTAVCVLQLQFPFLVPILAPSS